MKPQEIETQVLEFVIKHISVSVQDAQVITTWVLKTWKPLPDAVKYLQIIGNPGSGKTMTTDALQGICRNLFNTSGMASLAYVESIMDAHPCVPVFDMDIMDYLPGDEFFNLMIVGSSKAQGIMRMVVTNAGRYKPRVYNVFGYKVILATRKFKDPALQARCIPVMLTNPPREVRSPAFQADKRKIYEMLNEEFVSSDFRQSVNGLINTSVEDARSSANFCRPDVLRAALQLAMLGGRKTLAKVLQAEIRRREKKHAAKRKEQTDLKHFYEA